MPLLPPLRAEPCFRARVLCCVSRLLTYTHMLQSSDTGTQLSPSQGYLVFGFFFFLTLKMEFSGGKVTFYLTLVRESTSPMFM